jgi:hypothetical protein
MRRGDQSTKQPTPRTGWRPNRGRNRAHPRCLFALAPLLSSEGQQKLGLTEMDAPLPPLRLPTRTWDEVLMTTLMELQGAIEEGMRRGESFSTVEDEIIEPSRMSDEAKSALWLYAWSFVDWRAQRREAYAHIMQIAESSPPYPAFN